MDGKVFQLRKEKIKTFNEIINWNGFLFGIIFCVLYFYYFYEKTNENINRQNKVQLHALSTVSQLKKVVY